MFFPNQPKEQQEKYSRLLQLMGSLSRLFSENPTPYLYYRIAEIAFCRAFEANDLSRSDVAVDAAKCKLGIGLKTFMYRKGKSLEKIAEFNKSRNLYKDFQEAPKELARIVAELRNKRIEYAMNLHGLNDSIYHWVARKPGEFLIFEEDMDLIDLKKIKGVKKNKNSIKFYDSKNEYNFNISKSTLFKRFNTPLEAFKVPISIIDDPFTVLESLLLPEDIKGIETGVEFDSIMLPLYSENSNQGKFVPQKSGLNQWNADGRKRHQDELYIRIPAWIHRKIPDFLPPRDQIFDLRLPNGSIISAKVCQDNSKALMSNPNKELGHWLLREVLEVPEGKTVTYEMLEWLGIDTVELSKINEGTFELHFKEAGIFEEFEENYNI